MSTLALVVATALVVTGTVAAAGTAVERARAVAAVAAGAVLLVVADSGSLAAGATVRSMAVAGVPPAAALLGVVVIGLRPATVTALVGAVVAGPLRQVLDDPFHDPTCLAGCDPNPLALLPDPAAADVAHAVGGLVLLAGLVLPARSRAPRAVLLAVVAALLAVDAFLAPATPGINGGRAMTAMVCLAVAVLVTDLARATTTRARLTAAVAALASTQDPEPVLAEALGVREVSLGFPVGDALVDRDGHPIGPAPHEWTAVEVSGPDGLIAHLRADLRGVPPTALARALRGPTRLALENNRLAAEAAVATEQVRASARRLVELAEQGRRRLERDLHDGAQRHVLTLGLAVQADEELPPELRATAATRVRHVLDQLRDVAHGIRPPQLDTGGLARGLAVLADHSPVPLAVGAVPDGLDGPAAQAAYRLVEDVLRTARGPVTVVIGADDTGCSAIVVEATEGGALADGSADRFRALGGTVHSAREGAGWRHQATLALTLR